MKQKMDPMKRQEQVNELVKSLEEGIKSIFESDQYVEYLNFLSRFHDYSFSNVMLIMAQRPDATLCAGFRTWEKLGRHVNKGEKAINILAPASFKCPVKSEEDGGEQSKELNENPTEQKFVRTQGFLVVNIFDQSQTSGAELPSLGVDELQGGVDGYQDFINALTSVSPVPVEYESIRGQAKGYFSPSEHRIVVKEGMSELQTVKTLVHEISHSLLHDKIRSQIEDVDDFRKQTRNSKEVEAESVAYVVCKHFGIDTSEYSFAYVTVWSSGKELKELKQSLDTINKTANWMIEKIGGEMMQGEKIGMCEIS